MKVKYHWSIFKTDSQLELDDKEKFYFKIEPEGGTFNPDEHIQFKISFLTEINIPIFEYASLIIDDIPF